MKKALSANRRTLLCTLGLAALALVSRAPVEAQEIGPFTTQTIELEAGWNAVYLQLEPTEDDPDLLFGGTPIQIVASYIRPVSSQQFVESPNEVLADPKGWKVWYRPGRADELLTDLYGILAHNAYLVYTDEDYTWQLAGTPMYGTSQWHPNAYSLVGFPIDAAQAPTVESFFAGVDAHADLKVYQLVSGSWRLITEPASTLMQPGVAYWTHSRGASKFNGPLQVDFNTKSIGGLVYNIGAGAQKLILTNTFPYPQSLDLSMVAGEAGLVPLAYGVLQVNGDTDSVDQVTQPLGDGIRIDALEAGESLTLDLEVQQSEVTAPLLTSTLIVSSDAGLRIEIPVVSVRPDLED